MSALPGRRLFDHPIGPQQQRRRDRETHHLRGPNVEDKVESSRLLNREIPGLDASQNLIDILSTAAEHFEGVWAVHHESTSFNEFGVREHGGKFLFDRE